MSRELEKIGLSVAHIHNDGHLELHADSMTRLLKNLGLPEYDLFKSRKQLVEEAYTFQEQKIAYFDENFGERQSLAKG